MNRFAHSLKQNGCRRLCTFQPLQRQINAVRHFMLIMRRVSVLQLRTKNKKTAGTHGMLERANSRETPSRRCQKVKFLLPLFYRLQRTL